MKQTKEKLSQQSLGAAEGGGPAPDLVNPYKEDNAKLVKVTTVRFLAWSACV